MRLYLPLDFAEYLYNLIKIRYMANQFSKLYKIKIKLKSIFFLSIFYLVLIYSIVLFPLPLLKKILIPNLTLCEKTSKALLKINSLIYSL